MKEKGSRLAAGLGIAIMLPLPMLGLWLTGALEPHYFEFPPITHYVKHAAFSWPAFIIMAAAIAACCLPVILKIFSWSVSSRLQSSSLNLQPFPLWGWLGVLFTAATWVVAWNRFGWAATIQNHTFFPLWIGYITVMSALTYRRKGSCLLTSQPLQMLLLFLLSAFFWWYFEYLNRFVQNWFYFGVERFSAASYFWFATLPFATVLPAVMTTNELLNTYPCFNMPFKAWHPILLKHPRLLAGAWLLAGVLSLIAIGLVPNLLFPMLWLSPLIIITALQTLSGIPTIFATLRNGNWQAIVTFAVATLICGFFWEMWNSRGAAGWIYNVPFVGRFKIFEMPILGFAGYLPFGLECAVIAELVTGNKTEAVGQNETE